VPVDQNSILKTDFDVVIIGGGLAGLISAILLAQEKKKVLVIEKKSYPFHKVCGEYVSNEVLPFLESIGLDPFALGATKITRLRVSTPSGKNIFAPLDLGGFGLSRYVLDHALYQVAVKSGADMLTSTRVTEISFQDNIFEVQTNTGNKFTAKFLLGCYGKRDALDKKLNRDFIREHTGYMGVKYHIKTDYPAGEIGLDNFENGYCGIAGVEENKFNVCYLYRRGKTHSFHTVRQLEEAVLFKNPVLKSIFSNSEFIFDQPEVINEISFAPKPAVENHVLMCGDSAGLIAPLCGNGMSMAIHSGKMASGLLLKSGLLDQALIKTEERETIEEQYRKQWDYHFRRRLFYGNMLQNLFGNPLLTGLSIRMIHALPALEEWLISKTHGKQNELQVIR